MFTAGQIFYFSPFYFKNGNTAKNKYFIVLKTVGDVNVIASLPTRTNSVPSFLSQTHGCINYDDGCFNCYVFEGGRAICDNGFSFRTHTFVYGNEVENYEMSILKSIYPIEGVDYYIEGNLLSNELDELIKCIKESKSVYRKIKRML